jgi:hypothetical protein
MGDNTMSNRTVRIIFRWAHIVEGSLIAAFIYSSSLQASAVFTGLIQFVVLPAAMISGIAMWQQPRLGKLLKRMKGRSTSQPTSA